MTRIAWPTLKRSLVAILRGVQPNEIEGIAAALIEEGFEAVEIPLSSPDPFTSIETAAKIAPGSVLIGAGTVLTEADVDRLNDSGGRLFISPNVNPPVIVRAATHGMVTMPGIFTPTEALAAVAAGASGLKFFPASVLGPSGIKAIRAVLPPEIEVGAVGGVSEKDFAAYAATGIRTFGMGSSLYAPGMDASEVRKRAKATITAYDAVYAA
jgi:2-dehydro-3-deoxyphosphogalactonate aldolase